MARKVPSGVINFAKVGFDVTISRVSLWAHTPREIRHTSSPIFVLPARTLIILEREILAQKASNWPRGEKQGEIYRKERSLVHTHTQTGVRERNRDKITT